MGDNKLSTSLMSRRKFLQFSSLATLGVVAGCATNPVTGERQLMLISEEQEIAIDRERAPYQFSEDYGPLQNQSLNSYINGVGLKLASKSHRPHMPYSFRGVNAVYINAYAFPGGSIAATRGILVELETEAAMAALLGHEIGHVNARHTAEQMSKGLLAQLFISGASIFASAYGYGELTQQLGMLGAGALLAKYSRDNEREADALGMEYMVRAGYNPKGMIELMELLLRHSKRNYGPAQLLFATHPMSQERYNTAVNRAKTKYANAMASLPLYRERFMDSMAPLLAKKKPIQIFQKADTSLRQKKVNEAEQLFKQGLRLAPHDYAGLLMMAKCQLIKNNPREGYAYAAEANRVYPQEPQSYLIKGVAELKLNKFQQAYQDLDKYDHMLPGNPTVTFYKGLALEHMGRREEAARAYYSYLQRVRQGEMAKYAYSRLVQWGYLRR